MGSRAQHREDDPAREAAWACPSSGGSRRSTDGACPTGQGQATIPADSLNSQEVAWQ